ncbi:hypothetical protein R5R35_011621 [Gryllus longicercus]|uniref:Serpin domain-containing protein n=1 Tax=Gryllus longicercus TaxID=2509291 RepID=A0AAN9VZD3_9ORTH
MKILLFFALGVAYAAAQTVCVPESQEELDYHVVLSAVEAFAINLYQEVRSEAAGNVVVSPLSSAMVLALTWIGANGRTAQQLGDVLHLPLSRERVATGFRMLMGSLPTASNRSDDDPLVQLANRLYIPNGYQLEEAFSQTAVEDFKSDVEKLDFADSDVARNTINQWVANNTDDLIQNLIPEGFLSAETRLVLVNALLFIGMWSQPFDESETESKPFHLSENEQVNVSMMHGSLRLDYSELPDFDATVLRLPYRGSNIESDMLILLPNAVDGLEALESNLGQVEIFNIQFQIRQVTADIPSFKVETTIDLKDGLQSLHVHDLFDNQADLSGISNEPLYVSGAVQKAYIEVNENGTVAAAATAVGVAPLSVPQPAEFNANHPFLFILRIEETIAFIGRVSDPSQ